MRGYDVNESSPRNFHDEEGGEYSNVEQADVGRLVKALNDHLGSTPDTVNDIELFSK